MSCCVFVYVSEVLFSGMSDSLCVGVGFMLCHREGWVWGQAAMLAWRLAQCAGGAGLCLLLVVDRLRCRVGVCGVGGVSLVVAGLGWILGRF